MQDAEDEPEGSLHEVNDRRRIPIATQQITYFYTPPEKLTGDNVCRLSSLTPKIILNL